MFTLRATNKAFINTYYNLYPERVDPAMDAHEKASKDAAGPKPAYHPDISGAAARRAAEGKAIQLDTAEADALIQNLPGPTKRLALGNMDGLIVKDAASDTAPKTHTVASGDTLGMIAKANNTTVAILQKLNNIPNVDRIVPGQVIKLPGDVTTVATGPAPAPVVRQAPTQALRNDPAPAQKTAKAKPANNEPDIKGEPNVSTVDGAKTNLAKILATTTTDYPSLTGEAKQRLDVTRTAIDGLNNKGQLNPGEAQGLAALKKAEAQITTALEQLKQAKSKENIQSAYAGITYSRNLSKELEGQYKKFLEANPDFTKFSLNLGTKNKAEYEALKGSLVTAAAISKNSEAIRDIANAGYPDTFEAAIAPYTLNNRELVASLKNSKIPTVAQASEKALTTSA